MVQLHASDTRLQVSKQTQSGLQILHHNLPVLQEARPDITDIETWLFHGAHKSCIELIAAKGFDIRVSGRGTLGQGTYFSDCSAYSDR